MDIEFFSPLELVKYLQGHPEKRQKYLKYLNLYKEFGVYPNIRKKNRIDF